MKLENNLEIRVYDEEMGDNLKDMLQQYVYMTIKETFYIFHLAKLIEKENLIACIKRLPQTVE